MSRPIQSEITKLQLSTIKNMCGRVSAFRDKNGNAVVEIGKGTKRVAFSINSLGTPTDVRVIEGHRGRPPKKEESNAKVSSSIPETSANIPQENQEKRGPGRPKNSENHPILEKRGRGMPRKETSTSPEQVATVKRGPGRPKGSKNKETAMAQT